MRRLTYIFCIMLLAGCGRDRDTVPPGGAVIRLETRAHEGGIPARLIDGDNTAAEQTVNNISVFLTEPGQSGITHSYVHSGFSASGEYMQVSLPLDPGSLGTKDIYVVANHGDTAALGSAGTIGELEAIRTPFADKNNNLEPQNGFCMYGMLAGFDFGAADAGAAPVTVERTCAKYRITLTFPQDSNLSAVNSFVVGNAANYTFVGADTGLKIPADAYFNFAEPMPLIPDGEGAYINTAYVYEASAAPHIYIYTRMDGAEQMFTAFLPVPVRNYMYDIRVEVYRDVISRSAENTYTVRTAVTGYR